MIYSEELLQRLAQLSPITWSGEVYRHMFGTASPARDNTVGARWNPPEIAAIYTSLRRETALAEGDFYVAMQPLRPKAVRRLHRIDVSLSSVLDLRDWSLLHELGIEKAAFTQPEPFRCKEVGGAVAHLGHDGLLAPSARDQGANLVIFLGNKTAAYDFSPIDFVVV